jgi:hypothetical protein
LGLAVLYYNLNEDNNSLNDPTIRNSIKSGLLYWCSIQNKDGSFNEYYQNDRSFCPTAFTTYAAAKTFYLGRDIFSESEQSLIETAISKSGSWLTKHSFPEVQNQMIASMNALFYASQVLNDQILKEAFVKRKNEVLNAQDKEGWFPEYNGADIGYSFMALDLFANYLDQNYDEDVIETVTKLIRFIIRFIHPDGTVGSTYGSRCTSHVLPYGINYFSNLGFPEAVYLYDWYTHHKKGHRIIDPLQIDDKYFAYFYFNSYAQSHLMEKPVKTTIDSASIEFESIEQFGNAGLLRYEQGKIQAFVSWKRKGVCQIYFYNNLVYSDTGYFFRLSNGSIGATQVMDKDATIDLDEKNNVLQLRIQGKSGKVDDSLPLVKWMVPFKLFCRSVLRWDNIGYWFNRRLKEMRVKKQYPLPVSIVRDMQISQEEIIIKDQLNIDVAGFTFSDIELTRNVTTVHSPSSRFLQHQHLVPYYTPSESEQTERSARFTYKIPLQGDHS